MPYYAVEYHYDSATAAQQDELRPSHRAHLQHLADNGLLIASGPLSTRPASALLIFRAEGESHIREALANDPFQVHGYVTDWTITPWAPVIGVFAEK
ncbi:YciI family protein [Dermatophilus congolensis]|uniref:YciI family protein n=1 Tax=Dermatophilus congolensis TaxID=1863 RepID=UPI000E0E74AF|nr:YciI family protein [Dermatophilus congolensis]